MLLKRRLVPLVGLEEDVAALGVALLLGHRLGAHIGAFATTTSRAAPTKNSQKRDAVARGMVAPPLRSDRLQPMRLGVGKRLGQMHKLKWNIIEAKTVDQGGPLIRVVQRPACSHNDQGASVLHHWTFDTADRCVRGFAAMRAGSAHHRCSDCSTVAY